MTIELVGIHRLIGNDKWNSVHPVSHNNDTSLHSAKLGYHGNAFMQSEGSPLTLECWVLSGSFKRRPFKREVTPRITALVNCFY